MNLVHPGIAWFTRITQVTKVCPPLSGADPGVTRVLPGCYPGCPGCYLDFLYITQVLLRLSGGCLDNTGCMGVTCMLPDLPECIPGGSQVEHMMFPWVARILRFPHGLPAATRNLRNPAPPPLE